MTLFIAASTLRLGSGDQLSVSGRPMLKIKIL